MARRPAKKKAETAEPAEHRAVVVGWTHNGLGSSIDLRIQSTVPKLPLRVKPSLWRRFLPKRQK